MHVSLAGTLLSNTWPSFPFAHVSRSEQQGPVNELHGSPEQQALMNYKPHIVHGGQKVQALATLDALHVLQLDPPEPAHPPHFVPAGAGNRQQRIVLCVEALQAAAKAAVVSGLKGILLNSSCIARSFTERSCGSHTRSEVAIEVAAGSRMG
eukprot:1159855-Pelagomonas_calceolata.AAC.5